jgi:hypothetical protein
MAEIPEKIAELLCRVEVGKALILKHSESGRYYLNEMDLREASNEVERHSTGMSAILSVRVFLRVE